MEPSEDYTAKLAQLSLEEADDRRNRPSNHWTEHFVAHDTRVPARDPIASPGSVSSFSAESEGEESHNGSVESAPDHDPLPFSYEILDQLRRRINSRDDIPIVEYPERRYPRVTAV
jgi:hypothetical protein